MSGMIRKGITLWETVGMPATEVEQPVINFVVPYAKEEAARYILTKISPNTVRSVSL